MPQIGQRIFVAGGADNYCSLANEELIRYIGSDWTSIRIGMMAALNTNGVANITGRLAVGVCSGNTRPVGNAATTLFVGNRTLVGSPTWTYNANAGNPYFSQSAQSGLRRVAGVDTTLSVGVTNFFIASNNGSLQRRSLIYADLIKTAGETPFCTPVAQMALDNSFSNFLEGLEYAGATPTVQNVAMTAATQQATSFDETPGLLDHVDVQWTGVTEALEIYAWGVWRRA